MKKYLVIIEGTGEGCDYTIGCNLRWDFFDAESLEDLKEQIIKEYYAYEDDDTEYYVPEIGVERAIVTEIASHHIMDDIHDIGLARAEKTIEKGMEDDERKEYERLKKKFG